MGVIWERYGRDKNHLSHTASPLYKGVSEDYGSDEALPQKSIQKKASAHAEAPFKFSYLSI